MKRIIVALLAVLMVFGLASCNDNPNNVGLIIGNQMSSSQKAAKAAEAVANEIEKAIAEEGLSIADDGTSSETTKNLSVSVGGEAFAGQLIAALNYDPSQLTYASSNEEAAGEGAETPAADENLFIGANLSSSKGNRLIIVAYYTFSADGSITERNVVAAYNQNQINISSSIFENVATDIISKYTATKAVADFANAIDRARLFADIKTAAEGINPIESLTGGTISGTSNNLTVELKSVNGQTGIFAELMRLAVMDDGTTEPLSIIATLSFADYSNGIKNYSDAKLSGSFEIEVTGSASRNGNTIFNFKNVDISTPSSLEFSANEDTHKFAIVDKYSQAVDITADPKMDGSIELVDPSDITADDLKLPVKDCGLSFIADDETVEYSDVYPLLDSDSNFQEEETVNPDDSGSQENTDQQ